MSLLSRLAVRAARAYGMLAGGASTNVPADFLVVAGGGGGGSRFAGGGGAGGLRTSAGTSGGGASAESGITLSTLNTYSIVVGAGGNGGVATGGSGTAGAGNGSNGSNSSLSGTGITTITSTGGGGGGAGDSNNGLSGGSGGGGAGRFASSGGSGTASQGYAGGNNTGPSIGPDTYVGSGGGGAGAAGNPSSGTSPYGGEGGNGVASSITGSSVTYAGGGGGGIGTGISGQGTQTVRPGGTGGGGAGGNNGTSPVDGTANLGGGGGGGNYYVGSNQVGGNGGSGVVIISYTSATPKFVGGTITTSGGKQIHTFTSSGTLSPITPITASYLVVAGGGGGGSNNGGGGGAGGLLASSTTLYTGATYLVTVGAGGSGAGSGSAASGSQGSNSVLSGTGLTTITSTGGGYGAGGSSNTVVVGGNGGSGGGGRTNNSSGGTGTSGQGNNGGTGGPFSGSYAAGGGGGAGAVGANASSSVAGDGGVGVASSISGTSTYYAGGGGGGLQTSGTIGAGGNGGGGSGSITTNATSGTTNTGGGGGGGGYDGTIRAGGAGGSGIVIISYAGSQAFNGGLVTTSGGNTIHTFTSSGALTPLTNNLNNSLRFRSSASAYLSRTLSTPTNNKIFTYSVWVKRGALGGNYALLSPASSGTGYTTLRFESDDTINFQEFTGSAYNYQLDTTQVFRDPSAWYHLVVAVDTTQATAANRIKLYVNGNQVTAFATATYPTQNLNPFFNSAVGHNVGANIYSGSREQYFDGYMTDINFIDGQALEPYYFGNNDANGVWKPIQYKGTYGTNGFYLTFGNTTSTTTLGYDSSPNGNNWTCNNISLTAGTTYDAMTDVPTNTSATVANYCTLNPVDTLNWLSQNASMTLSNGNLKFTSGSTGNMTEGTMGVSSGKWYYEITFESNNTFVGIRATRAIPTGDLTYRYYNNTGDISVCAFNSASPTNVATVASSASGVVMGVAFDLDNNTISWYKNNTLLYTLTGVVPDTYVPATGGAAVATASINFGQRPFAYTPPTGFVALNTYNLPTPTILQGNKYMDATLYTGTGTDLVIANQGQFKPDFVWTKCRSNAVDHCLVDAVRGGNKILYSDLTNAEDTSTFLSSFNSNGYTISSNAGGGGITSGRTYVGWQWQAGQGTTSSNTSGSITSTVSVNTTAGFSIVTYTGTGSAATIGHGLGVAPKMYVVKQRSASGNNWGVYHTGLTSALYAVFWSSTSAEDPASAYWNNTAPTSSVFSVGGSALGNASGATYVALCWAEIAGFSKFGSYTGNGSSDGPFVYLGFRPKFVMIKSSAGVADDWTIIDTSRSTYNLCAATLKPNTSAVEDTNVGTTRANIDILSNGFKIRQPSDIININTGTYIYAAFAENPFKNANAR